MNLFVLLFFIFRSNLVNNKCNVCIYILFISWRVHLHFFPILFFLGTIQFAYNDNIVLFVHYYLKLQVLALHALKYYSRQSYL